MVPDLASCVWRRKVTDAYSFFTNRTTQLSTKSITKPFAVPQMDARLNTAQLLNVANCASVQHRSTTEPFAVANGCQIQHRDSTAQLLDVANCASVEHFSITEPLAVANGC